MKDYVREVLSEMYQTDDTVDIDVLYNSSPLLQYIDLKTGAIYGNTKSRRSLANIYAIYAILHYYVDDFYNKPDEYRQFSGYDYTRLFNFYRGLYGGSKLQNHALNSRVNGEFKNKIVRENDNDLIIINNGRYALHIDYLYAEGVDISKAAIAIIEAYISLLQLKDNKLIGDIEQLIALESVSGKKKKISEMLDEDAEARIFEIISYAILRNHYLNTKVYIGYSAEELKEEYLTLYKTGRTNANDGGIDFVMRPLGRFFQVTEVNSYDKYLLDIDKVLHFPITFVVKTEDASEEIISQLQKYIDVKSSGMTIIKDRYNQAIEEIITINELKDWLNELEEGSVNAILKDIDLYYRIEMNMFDE